MATRQISTIIQHLRRAALVQDETAQTDGQLLESFLAQKDEAAFASLLRRHGAMVLGVCSRILNNHHDAEDAFQATFLVFARKASSVTPRERIANWLHGVAQRTALKARTMKAKSQVRERQVRQPPEPQSTENDHWDDLQPVLDEELGRLPENYRLPLLLCDLEGKSIKEATRQLGWPQGTLAGRLARARKMLAKRLTLRGIGLSGGGLAVVLADHVASACVPAPLAAATIKAATAIAAGQTVAAGIVSSQVVAITEGILKAMMLTKLKTMTAILLMIGVASSGGGTLARHTAAAQPRPDDNNKPVTAESKLDAERYAIAYQDAKTEPAPDRKAETPKSLDETKLHGEWRLVQPNSGDGPVGGIVLNERNFDIDGKGDANEDHSFIFGPNNALRLITQKGRDETGTYSVDWSKKPHHLDIKWGKNPTGRTIMEITQDGKLRIEDGKPTETDDEMGRPIKFTDAVCVFTKREAPAVGSKQAEAAATKDLGLAEFYHKTGHFASAYFYGELVKRRYPDTEFAKKATQILVEINKHRVRRLDGSEGWEHLQLWSPPFSPPEPQPLPPPTMGPPYETPDRGPRTVVLENAKLTLDASAKMRVTPVKTAKGPRVRVEIEGNQTTVTVETPKFRIESKTKIIEVVATEAGPLEMKTINLNEEVLKLGEIIVVGNKKTPTAAIVKKLALHPGQPLDDETVQAAEKRLSAFAATITIEKELTDGPFADIVVRIKEKSGGR